MVVSNNIRPTAADNNLNIYNNLFLPEILSLLSFVKTWCYGVFSEGFWCCIHELD